MRSAPGKCYNYKAAAQKRVFSTSNRNPYSSDAVDSHLGQMLASFVLSTWFKFSICLLFAMCLVHTLSINVPTSYTGHLSLAPCFFLCVFRNLVRIREFVLVLDTLFCYVVPISTHSSSQDNDQFDTVTQAPFFGSVLIVNPLFFSIHLLRETVPAHKSHMSVSPCSSWFLLPCPEMPVRPWQLHQAEPATSTWASLKPLRQFSWQKFHRKSRGLDWQLNAIFHIPTEFFSY